MKNETIKVLLGRVEKDEPLTKEEQVEVLKDLLRANRRVQAAKRAGYIEGGRAQSEKKLNVANLPH